MIKASNKRRWFISSFNFKPMDMVTFKTSLNKQWPLNQFKMQVMRTIDKLILYSMIYAMQMERRIGQWPYDQFTCCNKGQWLFKIKRLLDTWLFRLKTCIVHIPSQKATFWITNIQKKTSNLHFTLF